MKNTNPYEFPTLMNPDQIPPAILQILPAFDAGGVERVTFETVTGLANIHFATHHVASAGGRYSNMLPANVTHHQLPLNTKNPALILANAVRLYNLIKTENIHVAHARSRAPGWSARLACQFAKIPLITTYHGTYNWTFGPKRLYNSIMARGDRVIAISHFIMRHIKQTHPTLLSKLTFVPEGIDTAYFDPASVTEDRITAARKAFDIPTDAKVLLLPGRLTHWKGQAWFLKALGTCVDFLHQQNIHCVILGDPQGRTAYQDKLIQLARPITEAGVPVHFVKEYTDLPAAYALAECVFSCSLEPEAFGRIAAEALSMGRPFIGTNHGGTIELTGEGAFGSLVVPGDNDALVAEIKCLLTKDKTELMHQGVQARAHITAHYSLVEMLRLTQDVYESVL